MFTAAQKDANFLIKTVAVIYNGYIALAYTEKHSNDVGKFCCKATNSSSMDTTFNLCDMWITDTSYKNLWLINADTGKNPAHSEPIMAHFTEKEKTFFLFALEPFLESPNLNNLKMVGVDLESAIYNYFRKIIPNVARLVRASCRNRKEHY